MVTMVLVKHMTHNTPVVKKRASTRNIERLIKSTKRGVGLSKYGERQANGQPSVK